jgi:copper homeostasis protein
MMQQLLNEPLYEVIVSTFEDALAAWEGGANRLEIISHYEIGGLTPSFELVREIVEHIKIPARVMLREEESFFLPDEKKRERICDVARSFQELSIDGLVFGFLRTGQNHKIEIDHGLIEQALACVPGKKATFHRAFEELSDPLAAVGELKGHPQIDCILTSGGAGSWESKVQPVEDLRQAARPEIETLVGGGTDAHVISLFLKSTGVRAFHVGRAVREEERLDGAVQADLVRALKNLLG